MHSSIQKSQ